MTHFIARGFGIALCALALHACSEGPRAVGKLAASAPPPMAAGLMEERGSAAARRADNTLAYEHSVSVEIGKDLLQARMQEVQAACAARPDAGCTLLDVSSDAESTVPRGSLRMRLAPTAIDPLIALASKDARIVQRSTHAEDLAEPIADTERQLTLLTTHRDRLAEIQKSRTLNVDQLITVSRELSTVQTQIDAMATQRATLRRRIDTEVLTINLAPPTYAYGAEQTPVRDALKSFGATLRQAVANVIQFVAALLPWLVIIVPGLILLRVLWRWISRLVSRRETRA
jgi:hypothetical protein